MRTQSGQSQLKWLNFSLHAVGACVVVASVALVYFYGFKSLNTQQELLETRHQEYNLLIGQAESVNAEYEKVSAELSQQQTKLVALLKRMPETAQEVDFLAQITRISQETDIHIQEFFPQNVENGGEYRELEIKVTAQGGYVSLCHFLNDMHDLQRLNRVSQLKIARINSSQRYRTATNNQDDYQIEMRLHIYYMPIQKAKQIAQITGGKRG